MTSTVALSVNTGTRVTVVATFTDDDTDAVADPLTVLVKYRDPTVGTPVTLTYGVDAAVVRKSVGVYEYQRVLDNPGLWWLQFVASGATGPNAVEEVAIRANELAIP